MILSILIPTTHERKPLFDRLTAELKRQIKPFKGQIEIISAVDGKEKTVGQKRNELYSQAKGIYSWQIDDDDWIHPEAIKKILTAAKENSDCITFQEVVCFDGKKPQSSNFSIKYSDWADNKDGFDYTRTPFFKTPIKTELCKQVQVPEVRFAEDHEFARRIKPLLKTESHINDNIYWYLHYSTPFNERYGFNNN